MQSSDINIHKLFSIETLMHINMSNKTTHTPKNNAILAYASFPIWGCPRASELYRACPEVVNCMGLAPS
jgi:hypothetical protein